LHPFQSLVELFISSTSECLFILNEVISFLIQYYYNLYKKWTCEHRDILHRGKISMIHREKTAMNKTNRNLGQPQGWKEPTLPTPWFWSSNLGNLFCFVFGSNGVCSQVFAFVGQAFYCLSHASCLFVMAIFR
jgi:hypothetical protein